MDGAMSFLPFAGVSGGNSLQGAVNEAYGGLFKALEAGSGVTDVANLVGGGALRRQSLEATLVATIQQNPDFRAWNLLDKTPATATVDEWTEENDIGGWMGSAFNDELGDIEEQDAELKRHTLQIKYLMTRRRVSFVKELEGGIDRPTAVQQTAGALDLLTSAEWGLFNGDAEVMPQEFDGLYKIVNANAPTENVIDVKGEPLGNGAEEIQKAVAIASQFGNWGQSSHGFWSLGVQADLDSGLDPAQRVMVPWKGVDAAASSPGIMKGAPVVGIKSSFAHQGVVQAVYDKFILPSQPPAEAASGVFRKALNTGVVKPASIAAAAEADAASQFESKHSGNYYYAVSAVNKKGESAVTLVAAQVAVAAGDKVVLTITGGINGTETGYRVFRGRLNGSNALTDLREMARVAKAGDTTVYTDLNRDVPGSSKAFILNMVPGSQALTIRRLLPMMKFPLFPATRAEIVWAQLLFFALRVGKPSQHVIIKNIVPRVADWHPFN